MFGQSLLFFLLVCLPLFGQESTQIKDHPTTEDVASTFKRMASVLDDIDEPCSKLAANDYPIDVAFGLHSSIGTQRDILKSWDQLLSRKVMPPAKELFTIYTGFIDEIKSCENLANSQSNKSDNSRFNTELATRIIRALIPAVKLPSALEPAIYDAISKLEAEKCKGVR